MKNTKGTLSLRRINYIKVLKVAVGSTIAILLANVLGLKYSAAAGIITLLSITDTKRDTIKLAVNRFCAFIISIITAYWLFKWLGFTTVVFGLYILVFMCICCILRLSVAVSMCVVLTTHFLAEQSVSAAMIWNETCLFFIGVVIGVLLNLYMPDNVALIRADIQQIETDMKELLYGLVRQLSLEHKEEDELRSSEYEQFDRTKFHLEEAMKRAYDNFNNKLLSDAHYYLQYLDLRKAQVMKLEQIYEFVHHMTYLPPQTKGLVSFVRTIQESFHEYNNAKELIQQARDIKMTYQRQEIPKTREEFENRAILYLVLRELEEFLILKKEFVKGLTEQQIETFWK